jgi:hypothetical protein
MGTIDPATLAGTFEAAPVAALALPILSLDGILQADDLGSETVPMPEWGGVVIIRGLGYQEWNGIRSTATVNGELDEALFTKMLLSAAMTSPAVTQDQAALLMGKSVVAVDRLAKAVLKVSRIGEDAVAEAEATFPS